MLLSCLCCLLTLVASTSVVRTIPWDYKGYDSFPTNWFGANPTGSAKGEDNATLAIMAQHHLVGWGWQQGMYDIPCSVSAGQQCAQNAAQTLANYTIEHKLPDIPSFVYRNLEAGLLNFEDINQALNCSVNWTTYPKNYQACGLSDPAQEKLRREWFLHDTQGRVCGGRQGTPALQMTWVKSAPGALDYWQDVVAKWLVQHLSPSKAVFLDVVDNGGDWEHQLNSSQGNCSAGTIDPAQWNQELLTKEVDANIAVVHTIAAELKPLGKAVIINAGSRLSQDPAKALVPFGHFFERLNDIENIIWYFEAWNSTLDLSTALFMRERGMPKLVHWFGSNATKLVDQMAAFLIAQGDYDYFSASTEWTDGGWIPDWMLFHETYEATKCGRPLEPPRNTSTTVYTREFEHCSVRVDLACDTPSHDGCGTITPKTSDGTSASTPKGCYFDSCGCNCTSHTEEGCWSVNRTDCDCATGAGCWSKPQASQGCPSSSLKVCVKVHKGKTLLPLGSICAPKCPAGFVNVTQFCPQLPAGVQAGLDCLFHENPGTNASCPCPSHKDCKCESACALTGCASDAQCGEGRTCVKAGSGFAVCLYPWDTLACGSGEGTDQIVIELQDNLETMFTSFV